MDQRMHHPEVTGTGQGTATFDYTGMGNAVSPMATALNEATNAVVKIEKRNEKHHILLDRDAGAAGVGSHEISTPLRQLVPFFAQNKAFLRNML